jgi:hypothetical protein
LFVLVLSYAAAATNMTENSDSLSHKKGQTAKSRLSFFSIAPSLSVLVVIVILLIVVLVILILIVILIVILVIVLVIVVLVVILIIVHEIHLLIDTSIVCLL